MEIDSIDFIDDATLQVRGCIAKDEFEAAAREQASEESARIERLSNLLSEELERILTELGREMVGAPDIYLSPVAEDRGVSFTANLGLYPEPDITGYDHFEVSITEQPAEPVEIGRILADMLAAFSREQGREYQELTDEVAERMAPGVGGVEGLRQLVSEREERKNAEAEIEQIRAAIFGQLLERNPFSVPRQLVDDEIRNFVIADGRVLFKKGSDIRRISIEEFRNEYSERALDRVRLSIIIDKISEIENIQAEEEDIEQAIDEIAELHQTSYEDAHEYLTENGFILEVVLAITQEKVFQFLLERTQVHYRR